MNFSYLINNNILSLESYIKDLGIILSHDLNFPVLGFVKLHLFNLNV